MSYHSNYFSYEILLPADFFCFCFLNCRITKQKWKRGEFSTLHYVASTTESMICGFHCTRTIFHCVGHNFDDLSPFAIDVYKETPANNQTSVVTYHAAKIADGNISLLFEISRIRQQCFSMIFSAVI